MELLFIAKWGDGQVWTADCDFDDWEWDGNDLVDDIIEEWQAANPEVDSAEFTLIECGQEFARMSWTRENDSCCCWS